MYHKKQIQIRKGSILLKKLFVELKFDNKFKLTPGIKISFILGIKCSMYIIYILKLLFKSI